MNTEHQEALQDIVKGLISVMDFEATVEVTELPGVLGGLLCSIAVKDGQNFLIGQYGMNLAALQHLVRILARKRIGEKMEIIVDVNNYFSEKKQLLEKEAMQALEEALQKNVAVTLRPMLPYERKVIHACLVGNESVETESVGQGEERKVVVRPRPIGT